MESAALPSCGAVSSRATEANSYCAEIITSELFLAKFFLQMQKSSYPFAPIKGGGGGFSA